ncbi:cofactor-independent phosphoglycerate mutase [Thalassoglobus neptunius]|uniref:Cofactor-independent phosphoglycerate mutase n=1 Tax=Thalassoglobus neptunius TaxID=1938619 RepID=A0A5C5WMJ4_9PLAN|nr:cofactor-independent phosphoglycerate mutase [Thalassoglobus neptunius]TWT52034.1 cofactor-independent phosphoglycerate mutase [Thalassoglobus neptunius]
MKYALVIPDGCADEAQDSLGGKTPLEAAKVPHMDEIAKLGRLGLTDNVPESMPSGSDVGTMSLFGYDPLVYHTGRAPLEAAAQGIELEAGDWAIRCNLVTVVDGIMKSFTAGQISNDVARELIELLQSHCCGDQHWKFHAGVSYRNLLIYRARGDKAPFASDTYTVPPHDITDQPISDHLPMGSGGCDLRALMDKSVELFESSQANQKRLADGLLPATQAWLWGQGSRPNLQLFSERFGVSGAVITAVDLLRGIGKLIGWDVVEVEGATGYLDTDYAAKGRAAIETLNKGHDFVVVHVEATDEASHEGLAEEKVTALEEIDEKIVGPLHRHLRDQGDYRILVCPDHPTFLRTKTHSHGYVPYAFCGSDVPCVGASAYNEPSARQTNEVIEQGHNLMGTFFDLSGSDSE